MNSWQPDRAAVQTLLNQAPQSRHHEEHPAEPFLRFYQQHAGNSIGSGGALSILSFAAKPNRFRSRDEPKFRLGHRQRLAFTEGDDVM